jgi:D-aspartate ligase
MIDCKENSMRLPNQKPKADAQHRTPAVVAGGSLNALGVVRSLSAGHMPIYLLDTTRECAAGWSRHCRFVATPALDGMALVNTLVDLAKKLACRPVLILTSDQCVDAVSAHRRELEPLYHFSMPAEAMVRALADKTLFQSLAEREHFEVPRAVCIGSASDLERIANLQPPLIIKPGDKTLVLRGLADRVLRADTVAEARAACERMLEHAPGIIVQEWIDGPDSDLLFTLFACDGAGKPLGMFHGRKLVVDPPEVGTTAICRPAPEVAAELQPLAEKFIARVGYRGLGSLEFKRDRLRNRLVIIEPTVGRTDWQSEVATLCGVNLPLRLYLSELGLPQSATVAATRVAWRSSAGYRTGLGPDMRTVDGFFRWSDPLPACYYYIYERGLMRVWRRLVRAFAPPPSLRSTRP